MGPDVSAGALTPARPEPRASSSGPGEALAPRSRLRESGEAILVSIVFALFVRTFLLQGFVVPTASMETTIQVGDHVIVNKFVFAPHVSSLAERLLPYRAVARGDVIVFKFPGEPRRDFVKRAVGLPGDLVEIHDKAVLVNGRAESQPLAFHSDSRVWPAEPRVPEEMRRRDQLARLKVPPGSYFAMGDNRDNSFDSRFWGPVPAGNLKGRPLFVYWSFPPGGWARHSGPFTWIANFFAGTRWSRTFFPVR